MGTLVRPIADRQVPQHPVHSGTPGRPIGKSLFHRCPRVPFGHRLNSSNFVLTQELLSRPRPQPRLCAFGDDHASRIPMQFAHYGLLGPYPGLALAAESADFPHHMRRHHRSLHASDGGGGAFPDLIPSTTSHPLVAIESAAGVLGSALAPIAAPPPEKVLKTNQRSANGQAARVSVRGRQHSRRWLVTCLLVLETRKERRTEAGVVSLSLRECPRDLR